MILTRVFPGEEVGALQHYYVTYECKLTPAAYCFMSWRLPLEGYPNKIIVNIHHQILVRLKDQQVLI